MFKRFFKETISPKLNYCFILSFTVFIVLFSLNSFAQSTIYSEDFNSSFGSWTITQSTSGNWINGSNSKHSGSSGDYVYSEMTGNKLRYKKNANLIIESPSLDFSGYDNLTFELDIWYDSSRDVDDGLKIEYSLNNGSSWSDLGTVSTSNWYNQSDMDGFSDGEDGWGGNSNGWSTKSINLSLENMAFDDNSQVRLRIMFASDSKRNDTGVAFDNVLIQGVSMANPEMDISGNGSSISDGDSTPTVLDATDFGSLDVNSGTTSHTFTINNTGTANLTVSNPVLTGDLSDFTVTVNPSLTVVPSGSTTFTIDFDPTVIGIRTAIVSISTNDSDENPYTFTIQGSGFTLNPEIDILGNGSSISDGDSTPTVLDATDFGGLDVNSGIALHTFTINNTGTANLTISNPVLTGDISDFTITVNPSLTVVPSGSTTFTIDFDPTVIGIRTAIVSISTNDSDENPYTFTIQGSGFTLNPEIDILGNGSSISDGDSTPTVLDATDFGSLDVNSGTTSHTFTINNSGTAILTVSNPVLTGDISDFIITVNPSLTVVPSGSTTFTIDFDPTVIGIRTAIVSISNNDSDENPYTFTIQGTGIDNTPIYPSTIVAGDTWAYLDDGSNQGTAWSQLGFNDSTWSQGNAELGYGDGGEATVLSYGVDTNNKHITYYFRKLLTIDDPLIYGSLALEAIRDDGMVVYVNGTEVWSDNMPGTFNYLTNSSATISGSNETTWITTNIANSLIIGTNVIAVEIHQRDGTSSDLSFDFKLNGVLPMAEMDVQGLGVSIATGDTTPSPLDDTDFGSENINTGATTHTFTIANTGVLDLSLTDISPYVVLTGATSEFALTTIPSTPISASGNTTFAINFNPTSLGIKTATISILNDDSDENPYTFTIQGTGIDNTPIYPSTIVAGDTWTYLDNGSDQGTGWSQLGFDDSTWSQGNAELGYGDGSETTVVSYGGNSSSKYTTTYFRKELTIADPLIYTSIDLEAIRDDGLVVYLNGTEVWRDNMPTGTISNTTFANAAIGGGDESTFIITNIANNFVVGTNVIGVEIHQSSLTSSDISFDFTLDGVLTTPPEPSSIVAGATWKYLDDGSDQGASWTVIAFDDSSWSEGNAELGYGDGGESTVVSYGPSSSDKYITTYYRKSFSITDASAFSSIDLEAVRDDGMIVYLNGAEVWRDNMPSGAVSYTTTASSAISGSDEAVFQSINISNLLITGTNTVAVEIHQSSGTSSDTSFNFTLTPSTVPVGATQVVRGPYLQSGSPNSVIVKWRTTIPTESMINYGNSLGSLTSTITDGVLKTDHELILTGLTANTKYYYEIEDSSGVYVSENLERYYKSSPTTGTQQFVRAWILGDAGTANQNQRNVRDQYYSYVAGASSNPNQTDMMLFLGDNAYNSGTDSEYQNAFFDIYDEMLQKSVAWSTLGNHDGYSATSSSQSGPYYDIFSFPTAAEAGGVASGTEAYYSFDYGNIHFIVLESYKLYNDASQMAWCTTDIQSTTQDWIVAIFHHPPYTKGSHNSDSETELVAMRNNFLSILEDNGVDLVLNGHSHSYERSYFINGHYGVSSSFNSSSHTVGTNGDLSGKADTADGAYVKAISDTEGAVYITTGSAGKISGGSLNHNAMYASLNQLGSCILEVENDGGSGQNLNVKFLTDSGAITDYFTINKTYGGTSKFNAKSGRIQDANNTFNLYPVPASDILNVVIKNNEMLEVVNFYNNTGTLVKTSKQTKVKVNSMSSGLYVIEVVTDLNKYYQSVIIE